MTEQEIFEGNRVIAEFLGFVEKAYTPDSEKMWCDNRHGLPVGELAFHSSWEWLMPVVEKIEALNIQPTKKVVTIKGNYCVVNGGVMGHPSFTGISKIEATWKSVIDFIKWYNENSKQ